MVVIDKLCLVVVLAAVLAVSGCSRQQSDWEKTRTANTTDAYELFLKKYPKGEFTAQAQARVKELYEERDWQKARDTDTLEGYQAFLKQYPEGKWTEEARIRVENFTLASAPSNTNPPGADTTAPETSPPQPAPKKTAPAPKPAPAPSLHRRLPLPKRRPLPARERRQNRPGPMPFSSAPSNPAPTPRTSAGPGWKRNIRSCFQVCRPKFHRRRAPRARCTACRSPR